MIIKNDPLVIKIINLLMRDGKRSKAEKVLTRSLQEIDKRYPGQSTYILYLAALAVKQDIAVRIKPTPKKRRKSRSFNVFLPRVVSPQSGLNLGLRSLIIESRSKAKSEFKPLWECLSLELIKAAQNKGQVVKKRYSINKLAASSRRRIHFALSA